MKIVLASNNQGKLVELQALFAPLGFDIIAQGQLFQGEAEEPFDTFVENALAKARFAAHHTGLPAIADDAGLCVDAFGGLPGVQTAYYCTQFGYPKSNDNNVQALLEQMQHIDQRGAYMVSTLVGVRSAADPEPLIAVGKVRVEIARQRQGNNGFGFDPVLIVPELGCTFAELSEATKNQYSHRGRSSRQMVELVAQYWAAA
ncbi:RdgB/HAM1 family non-canonical purine NTP pyrophosphatase [Lampropedia aestuarii]|uniref:dITP/XTP pyrophosphatase n=1 Tax=Lampropedia aestuarii TaxID=2562762 RepID=A0A4S5C208_9BURK|nr:RdgB/HAM1 family non-canonical purine NTP pyrophosphatase [Lampropedia aestuarii]THJ36498.1 RdgB/HAM1 family non-canonical purine NTP pyrophosphatase [Lampropedia aestuarii]